MSQRSLPVEPHPMSSEHQLSDVLSEFARTMVTDFPIQAILDHLVSRIVDVLPITGAGVTLISAGADPRYVAASDESALRYEELQTELGEGPCLTAYRTGGSVEIADIRDDARYPAFAPRAVAAGLVAAFTFPLRSQGGALGALDLYRDTPGLLDAASLDAAQTLADVAAAYLLNAQARADLQDSSDRSRERSLHDALTGLPNRVLLLERLDHAVSRSSRSGKTTAVLFIDLDRFKQVNDLFGHGVGDQLLVAVGRRISAILRPGDTLARLSGDEFVILCEDLDAPDEVDAIAGRIHAALEGPFDLSDAQVDVTASVGIAFSNQGDHVSEELLGDADAAMYKAKREGGARHQIIDLRERRPATASAGLARDLQHALPNAELRTLYQPIVEAKEGRVVAVEALLRWVHPTRGSVPPSLFIPHAERSGLITPIGRWVLRQACTDRARFQDARPARDLTMSVNVSVHQLMSAGFAADVANVLSETHTDPRLVTLEVTESVFVQDSERALVVLNDLKALGVVLALDDFGTGFSSLNHLKRFPVDVVKIDQTFVADLQHNEASDAIVLAIVELAHRLGMTVVAEGVETPEQLAKLSSFGCDYCQGNYFARPMSADDFEGRASAARSRDSDGSASGESRGSIVKEAAIVRVANGHARVGLLGSFSLQVGTQSLRLPLNAQRLVSFLALNDGEVLREHVAGSLWGDATERHAAGSLRSALWRLGHPADPVVEVTDAHLRLSPNVVVDVRAIEALARRILDESTELDEGDMDEVSLSKDLLTDWTEDWVLIRREYHTQLRLRALEALCRRLTAMGRHGQATQAGLLAVAAEPLRESAQRALIAASLAEGNVAAARAQYDSFRTLLRNELDLEPSTEMAAMIEGLHR